MHPGLTLSHRHMGSGCRTQRAGGWTGREGDRERVLEVSERGMCTVVREGPHLEVELTQQARLGVAFRYARVLLLIAAVPYMPTDPVTAMVSRSTTLLSHCMFHRGPVSTAV
jgi:hypothetical protein